jgi:hypothetical protein
MINQKHKITILLFTGIGIVLSLYTAPDANYSSVVHSFSVGFVISAIFYFIVVYLPEKQRREMVHKSLRSQYKQFKLECISTFLILSDSQEYETKETLLDLVEFRRYFKNSNKNGEVRWDAVANAIQSNDYYLKDIIYHLRMLNEEIRFTRSTVNLNDQEVFDFLNQLSQAIVRIESTKREYDDIKSFCGFLWPIFTGWNWVEGYSDTDVIKDMIGRAK